MYVQFVSAGVLLLALAAPAFAFPNQIPKGSPKKESDVPTVADFDGDGKADLAELTAAGVLRIDFAKNGFGRWDVAINNPGNLNAKVFAADFDGDRRIDICLRTQTGIWKIDYAKNGFGKWNLDRGITTNTKNAVLDFLGKSAAVLERPDSVEVFHINPQEGANGKMMILGYAVTKAGPKLTVDQFGLLRSLVLNVNNYQLETMPRTKQYPNFAIRITKGKKSITILYSSFTKLLLIARGDDEFSADFGPGAQELTQYLTTAFASAGNPAKEK